MVDAQRRPSSGLTGAAYPRRRPRSKLRSASPNTVAGKHGAVQDGQDFCLYYKVLERGRFIWPLPADGSVRLTSAQLAMLWEALTGAGRRGPLRRPERHPTALACGPKHADRGASTAPSLSAPMSYFEGQAVKGNEYCGHGEPDALCRLLIGLHHLPRFLARAAEVQFDEEIERR